ncbi:MAG: DNA internalization-related competence protein ComEC/Rec2 [Hydrogenophilaceae bacterium]|nr:DNA internalization-related competence protein ComEC/Rec2 [Hydrogenophilaceae bacterium]
MRRYLVAFAAGVWLLQQQPELPDARWLWMLPLLITAFFLPRSKVKWRQWLSMSLLALICVTLGFAWAAWRAQLRMADSLPAGWQGIDVRVEGVVAGLPDRDAFGERFDFRVERVLTPGERVPSRVRLSWPAPEWNSTVAPQRLKAGERWQFTVRLKPPHGTANPDGFDYEAWLLTRHIRATGYVREQVQARRIEDSTQPLDRLQALRDRLRQGIGNNTLNGHPQAGVIIALAVGDQGSIPHGNWRVYNRTGTNHLMSISGLHITLFAVLMGSMVYAIWRSVPALVLRLPARRAALLAGWLAALAYTLLAGFQIPAQRTLFMLTVIVVGLGLRREPRPFSLLILALFVVLLIDPWAVLAPGFWLSFGAVAAMMWAGQGLIGRSGKIVSWTRAQVAVTLALAPALLLLFHQISLISPLANALAIPVVSWGVVPLALAGMVISPLLHLAAGLMQGVEAALQWLSAFSWASWSLPSPAFSAVLLSLAGIIWLLAPGLPARWLGGFMFLPLLFPPVAVPRPGTFEAEVLDVGQGTAVLIRTAGHTLLYDTGPKLGDSDAGQQIVLPRLRALGISKLDGLILTHDDLDHTGGAASVLRDMETGWLMSSLPAEHPLLDRPSLRCVRGQHWQWDGVMFEILNPPGYAYEQPTRKDNDKSCVLKISQAKHSLLLTADAERIGELEMTERVAEELSSTVLMAGHHGSRTSSIDEFVNLVKPEYVIYSNGWKNRFGHPHPDVMARFRELGSNPHRTDYQGWIKLVFSNEGVSIEHWRDRHVRYWQKAL